MSNDPRRLLLAEYEAAVRAEAKAHGQLRPLSDQVIAVARKLIATGMSWFKVAKRMARVLGLPIDRDSIKRLAARLRKQASRVTLRHGNQIGGTGRETQPVASSVVQENPPPENAMPENKLIEKTTTTTTTVEKFAEDLEIDQREEDFGDEDLGEDDEPEERVKPTTTPRRKG